MLSANSPEPRCSVLKLAFSTAEIRSFSKANARLSATWNTSPLNLLLVYRAASHSSNCKTLGGENQLLIEVNNEQEQKKTKCVHGKKTLGQQGTKNQKLICARQG